MVRVVSSSNYSISIFIVHVATGRMGQMIKRRTNSKVAPFNGS